MLVSTLDDKIKRKRRRRQARFHSPVPAALVAEFSQSEHAAIAVVAETIRRAGGSCVLRPAGILKRAGVGSTAYRSAMSKARSFGLLASERQGKKYLTRVVWLEKPADIRQLLARVLAEEFARRRAAEPPSSPGRRKVATG